MSLFQVCCVCAVCVPCVCRVCAVCVLHACAWLVPDVAVEDVSERVEDADHRRHRTEKDDSSQRCDALQHRINPHARHLVHPTRPAGAQTGTAQSERTCLELDYG